MADLSDRGQIILIAGFTLAVSFVALALVVNSAIFTENLASRGQVSGASEALVGQSAVEQSVGETMAYANVHNETNGSTLETALREGISDLGVAGGLQAARGGRLANVSYESHVTGIRIADNQSGGSQFQSNNTSLPDPWGLATDVRQTRGVELTVTDKSALSTGASPFTLIANETNTATNIWKMEVVHDSGSLEITVSTPSAGPETCDVDVSAVTSFDIDVTRGVAAGERCHALTRAGSGGTKMWFAADVPTPYNVSIENGDNIRGNYSMVLRGGSAVSANVDDGPTTPGAPFVTDALYAATVDYRYVTHSVVYEARVRTAPGEPP